jgi:hypothetical protein
MSSLAVLKDVQSATPSAQVVTKYTTTGVVPNPAAPQTVFDASGVAPMGLYRWVYREYNPAGAGVAIAYGVLEKTAGGDAVSATLPGPIDFEYASVGLTVAYALQPNAALRMTGTAAGNSWVCEVSPYV